MIQIKRVGVLSYAKMLGVVSACFGVIIGVIYGLIFMVFGAALMASGSGGESTGAGASGLVIGLAFMIGFPIFYGVLGFIGGALGAVVYNVAAGFVGGIEIELEGTERTYAAPPPPQWNVGQQHPGQQPHSGQPPQYPY
jgi:hypothetical protein